MPGEGEGGCIQGACRASPLGRGVCYIQRGTWIHAPQLRAIQAAAAWHLAYVSVLVGGMRAVTIVTVADSMHLELQVLASTVANFHTAELQVLGLSGHSAPADSTSFELPPSVMRHAQKFPHVIKRLRFLGALLLSAENAPQGLRDDALLVFVDGQDVLLQRRIADLPAAYSRVLKSVGADEDAVLVSGESHCWPWVTLSELRSRPATDSYMPNETFRLPSGARLPSTGVCDALAKASPGHWCECDSNTTARARGLRSL